MAICAPPWLRSVWHYVGDMVSHGMVSHFAWLYVLPPWLRSVRHLGICSCMGWLWLVILHGYMCTTMAMVLHHGYSLLGIVLGIWLVILHVWSVRDIFAWLYVAMVS